MNDSVCVCARARVRACVCVRACACVRACVISRYGQQDRRGTQSCRSAAGGDKLHLPPHPPRACTDRTKGSCGNVAATILTAAAKDTESPAPRSKRFFSRAFARSCKRTPLRDETRDTCADQRGRHPDHPGVRHQHPLGALEEPPARVTPTARRSA